MTNVILKVEPALLESNARFATKNKTKRRPDKE